MKTLIETLSRTHRLTQQQLAELIANRTPELTQLAASEARRIQGEHYGNKVFIRGLIEISNHCKNDCLYCGIRRSNLNVSRYRLTSEEILDCCDKGYELGFRTFVLQGGEDLAFSDTVLVALIREIKRRHSDCAVTLSIGERSRESYRQLREAGADRFLLRHEAANADLYARLHPSEMSLQNRIDCLRTLKELGFQTGTGFMVGAPLQTASNIAEDLLLLADFQPAMVGIGPFIPHHETPFANQEGGTVELTLFLISLIRLLLPKALIPSTTALGTLDPEHGRQNGILAGANVVMPNLSPDSVRAKYMIYENKDTITETVAFLDWLRDEMTAIGYEVVIDRGDAHP